MLSMEQLEQLAEQIKAESEIYQIMRKQYKFERDGILSVGMGVMGKYDCPTHYDILLFKNYDITIEEKSPENMNKQGLFIHRTYLNANRPSKTYYKRKIIGSGVDFLDLAKNKYELETETLISLANRNWTKTTDNKCDINIRLIKIMKSKYIDILEYYKIIKYDKLQRKYIGYNDYAWK